MAIDRQDSPYRRGNRYDRLPIPMVEEHCIPVDAGAVQLVIESRRLTNAIVEETYHGEVASGIPFDDGGATLHVLGTDDGLEHLRFDCFEGEPHYHYVHNSSQTANQVMDYDVRANGDMLEWALRCIRTRLADMLPLAEGQALVPQLDQAAIGKAADEVEALAKEAQANMAKVRALKA